MDSHLTGQIYTKYHSMLLSFIQKRIDNKADAEDILQDTFLKIHARINTLSDDAKIQNWIYRITQNTIIDYYRKQNPTRDLPESLSKLNNAPHEETRREIAVCFLPLIKNLPPLYKKVLSLSEFDGLTQKEIAEQEELSLPAVKSRVQRGRKIIKDTLLQCCHFEFDHQGKVLDYQNKQPGCKECC